MAGGAVQGIRAARVAEDAADLRPAGWTYILRDNCRYLAISSAMAGRHLGGRRHSGAVRFPVIWQLQARGRIAIAISEQPLAAGGEAVRAPARRPGRRAGAERRLDGIGDKLGRLGV